jgi:hypothetical protein
LLEGRPEGCALDAFGVDFYWGWVCHGCLPALHHQSTISAYASQEVLCQD